MYCFHSHNLYSFLQDSSQLNFWDSDGITLITALQKEMLSLLFHRKRVLCLIAKSPVLSSKEKRLASTLLRSRTLTWTCPSVAAKQTLAMGKTKQPRAEHAWTMANSRQELWIEATRQQVIALETWVTLVPRNTTQKCWEYSITSIRAHTFSERSSHLLNSHLRNREFSWLRQGQGKTDPDTRSKATVIFSFPDPMIKTKDTILSTSP